MAFSLRTSTFLWVGAFCLLAAACRTPDVSGILDAGVEVPAALLDRSQQGLAIQVLSSEDVGGAGWTIVAIEENRVRVRRTSRGQSATVDIYPGNGRLLPRLANRPAGSGADRLTADERMHLADIAEGMSRALARMEAQVRQR